MIKLKIDCKVLNSNFFLDSFNFFPITEDFNAFQRSIFMGRSPLNMKIFIQKILVIFLIKEKKNLKLFSNTLDSWFKCCG